MKTKKILSAAVSLILVLSMLAPFASMTAFAEGTHGFYMTCDASVVNNKSDGFMIDFYSDSDDALCTYWSNANWSMYTLQTQSKRHYKKMEGGGAYAGLQIRGSKSDHVGIMSMWKYTIRERSAKEDTDLYAKVMYGKPGSYDNEGSGTNTIMPYDWKNGQWYRQLLFCWNDEETGDTMIGTWFYDYEADEWTLYAYFDTFLIDSYIKGNVNQFLENYWDTYNDRYRSFRYKNVYFLSHETKEWVAQPNLYVYSDGNVKAVGEAKCGVSEDKEYVWGQVDGSSSVDTDQVISVRAKLNTPEKPTCGKPEIKEFDAADLRKIAWSMSEHSTPQLSYKLVVTSPDGKELAKKYETRPEVTTVDLGEIAADGYTATLTVTDVFGAEVEKTFTVQGSGKTDEPDPVEPPDNKTDPENKTDPKGGEETAAAESSKKNGANKAGFFVLGTAAIVAIAIIAAVVLMCGTAVAIIVIVNKRKKSA